MTAEFERVVSSRELGRVPDEIDMMGLCEGCGCGGGNGSRRVGDGNYPRRRGWRVNSRDA